MIMKECNSAAWLAEVKKRVARLDSLKGEAAWNEAHELVAAAQILRDEIAVESGKERKDGTAK